MYNIIYIIPTYKYRKNDIEHKKYKKRGQKAPFDIGDIEIHPTERATIIPYAKDAPVNTVAKAPVITFAG